MKEQKNATQFSKKLLAWYDQNARDLPWRHTKDPYAIWISEIMLQQTRVEAVKEYYKRFLTALPTVQDLAQVDDERLMKLWQGLGYYSRARNLKQSAQIIVNELQGVFPNNKQELLKLKGVGDYTSGAIASIAFEERVPAVDGNVMRVFARVWQNELDIANPKTKRVFEELVQNTLPKTRIGDYNQAIMELGATVCLPNGAPLCATCPFREVCLAYQNNTIDQYPVKTPKKQRVVHPKTVFVVLVGDKVWLHKRANKGLLAGLWEFANVAGHKTKEESIVALHTMGVQVQNLQKLKDTKHIFTHLEWHMQTWIVHASRVQLQPDYVLASVQQLEQEFAIPNAFLNIKKQLLNVLKTQKNN